MQQSGNKAGHMATLCKCTCKTGIWYLPAFALWKPLSESLPVVCITSHNEGESQQRVCIDFCCLGKTGTETNEMLQAAFGESCLGRLKIFEWYSSFKSGC